MKNRLTRNLLMIVAIPVTFELALFSTCAVMLNLAEMERVNESRAINVLTGMAPTLISTIRNVTLAARSITTKKPVNRAEYLYERKAADQQLDAFESMSRLPEFAEHRQELLSISEQARRLNSTVDEVANADESSGFNLMKLFEIKRSFSKIDDALKIVLHDLNEKRVDLAEKDDRVRTVFHKVLWLSLGMSLLIALIGLYAFHRLITRPLNELTELSNALAAGRRFTPRFQAKNEIGDLSNSFEKMADELESRNRIERAIFENSSDIICAFDKDNCFLFANNAVEKLLGLQPQELVGKPVNTILPESLWGEVTRQLNEVRRKSTFSSFESSILKSNGSSLDVVWSLQYSAEESLVYGCLYNIDFEKKTEEMAKGMRSIVVGELMESLNEARGAVSRIESANLSQPKKLEQLDSKFVRIVQLLSDLGEAISKESTIMPISVANVSTADLVNVSLDSVIALANEKNLKPNLDVKDEIVCVDAGQIQRVIVNLLSNAIKVSPEFGDIDIRVDTLPDTEDKFFLEVTDHGPGIPLNKQHLLFERFQQLQKIQSLEG
ncbi:MAG: hypothetical protein C0469_08185 [Cyanobacteria bacterium DS2.3.42]|nr:hypothetical protein [Cyanobacteria bacterium DS2.3.42]